MWRKTRASSLRVISAACLLGLFPLAEFLISEEPQREIPFTVEAPLAPANTEHSGRIKTDADPDRAGLFTIQMPPPDPMTGTERVYYT